jgi:(2Fe-2S) ferredoxin
VVLRTKADCLRICAGGPILLIWPEGIAYGGVSPERIERIIAGEERRDSRRVVTV